MATQRLIIKNLWFGITWTQFAAEINFVKPIDKTRTHYKHNTKWKDMIRDFEDSRFLQEEDSRFFGNLKAKIRTQVLKYGSSQRWPHKALENSTPQLIPTYFDYKQFKFRSLHSPFNNLSLTLTSYLAVSKTMKVPDSKRWILASYDIPLINTL